MNARPLVICVDDEPAILEGIELHLARRFEVRCAVSGEEALRMLQERPDAAVLISDMRMPGVDGAALLAAARRLAPDTTRLLLTGQADLGAAIAAVNEGRVFRFMTKPCPPAQLLAVVEAAVAQHRLVTAEKELLERTLRGAVEALADALALSDPRLFGRATAVRTLALEMASRLQLAPLWPLEVAATLSYLGYVSLPRETVEKALYGGELSDDERRMLARVPEVTDRLLAHVPRLDAVRDILRRAQRSLQPAGYDETGEQRLIRRCADVLRAALEFDRSEASGQSSIAALQGLKVRAALHGAEALDALFDLRGGGDGRFEVRELPVLGLRPGMILAEDLCTQHGILLAPRGFTITASFVERARNVRLGSVREPVRVAVRCEAPAEA